MQISMHKIIYENLKHEQKNKTKQQRSAHVLKHFTGANHLKKSIHATQSNALLQALRHFTCSSKKVGYWFSCL
jgi:hypothetical protein